MRQRRKRVALLHTTTGYEADDFIAAAGRLDIDVVLGNNHCAKLGDAWGDGALALKFRQPDKAAAALVAHGHEHGLDAIVAIGDQPLLVGALAASELGLPCNAPKAVAACRDKVVSRTRLRNAGLPVPWFERFSKDADPRDFAERVPYPCVVKPLGLSASRGVMRADDAPSFVTTFERLRTLLSTADVQVERNEVHDWVLVEAFIPGAEVALEGLLDNGRLRVLALFDKPDPLDGPTFEETIYVTPSRHPETVQQAIVTACEEAARALGLEHGPIHAELRLSPSGPMLLEIAARSIGGLCSRVLRFGLGMSLEEIILRHALGMPLTESAREEKAAAVMMIPVPRAGSFRGCSGVEQARAVLGVDDVVITAKIGQQLQPLPEGSTYVGFIFARGDTPAMAEAAVRDAFAELRFDITPELSLVEAAG